MIHASFVTQILLLNLWAFITRKYNSTETKMCNSSKSYDKGTIRKKNSDIFLFLLPSLLGFLLYIWLDWWACLWTILQYFFKVFLQVGNLGTLVYLIMVTNRQYDRYNIFHKSPYCKDLEKWWKTLYISRKSLQ